MVGTCNFRLRQSDSRKRNWASESRPKADRDSFLTWIPPDKAVLVLRVPHRPFASRSTATGGSLSVDKGVKQGLGSRKRTTPARAVQGGFQNRGTRPVLGSHQRCIGPGM